MFCWPPSRASVEAITFACSGSNWIIDHKPILMTPLATSDQQTAVWAHFFTLKFIPFCIFWWRPKAFKSAYHYGNKIHALALMQKYFIEQEKKYSFIMISMWWLNKFRDSRIEISCRIVPIYKVNLIHQSSLIAVSLQ